jgi:hypothetical protein
LAHPKFYSAQNFNELEKFLKEEKQKAPQMIVYRFSIVPEYPQFVILAYIPK